MDSKVEEMFPMETMATLIQGFKKAMQDGTEASFSFLDVIMKDALIPENWELKLWETLVSAYPISRRNLMSSYYLFSEEVKQHAHFEYNYHLAMDDTPSNWVFYFTKAAHLGAFSKDPDDVQTIEDAFNALCRKCVPIWDQMHTAAQQRLEQLLDEVLHLKDPSGNRCYFDFASPIKDVVISPLSKDDINHFVGLAHELAKDKDATHHLCSNDELLKFLRFCKCVKHGHIEGYTDISADMIQVLLSRCVPLLIVSSPFVITEYFYLVCESGLATQAISWFRLHRETLLRKMSYGGISLSRSGVHSYFDMLNAPSRLAYALAKAAINGKDDILYMLLEDDTTVQAVNNQLFIDDLFALLRNFPNALKATATIYSNQRSYYSGYIKELVKKLLASAHEKACRNTSWEDWVMPEEFLIKNLLVEDFSLYYDDRSFLYQAIAEPDLEDVQILQIGYGHDLELAKVAMRKDSAAFFYLSPQIQRHPDILRILEEEKKNAQSFVF